MLGWSLRKERPVGGTRHKCLTKAMATGPQAQDVNDSALRPATSFYSIRPGTPEREVVQSEARCSHEEVGALGSGTSLAGDESDTAGAIVLKKSSSTFSSGKGSDTACAIVLKKYSSTFSSGTGPDKAVPEETLSEIDTWLGSLRSRDKQRKDQAADRRKDQAAGRKR